MKTVSVELQPCLKNRSGIGTYTFELTKRLNSDPALSILGNVFNFAGRHDNGEIYRALNCPVKENRMIPYSAFRLSQYAVPVSYSRIFGQSDVNLFFNYIIPSGVKGKACVTIHDLSYLRFPETLKKRNFIRLHSGMEKSVARADRILTISDFSKSEIIELLHVPEEKISIVPCAAPLKCKGSAFDALREKYGVIKPYFLFVSTIEPRKNIVRLLRAFDLVRKRTNQPYQIVLAGGNGWNNDEIYREVDNLSAKKDVVFTGFITEEEKISFYENAECLVFPSVYEGFGIPPLEAMQCGCPVVCADAASLPEVVGNAAALVDPYSIESIAGGMLQVISDRQLKDELVCNGYKQAKKFSWDKSAEKLKEICKEL